MFHRICIRTQETLASPLPLHPNDSHILGSKTISRKEPHNSKLPHSLSSNQTEDIETDGEIDVDDCDDGTFQPSAGPI